MDGSSQISVEVLGRYAADAAREVEGVRALAEGGLPRHRGVRVTEHDGVVSVELHLVLDWGASVPEVGRVVQERVADYLGRMADVRPQSVDVVVDEITAPPAGVP